MPCDRDRAETTRWDWIRTVVARENISVAAMNKIVSRENHPCGDRLYSRIHVLTPYATAKAP